MKTKVMQALSGKPKENTAVALLSLLARQPNVTRLLSDMAQRAAEDLGIEGEVSCGISVTCQSKKTLIAASSATSLRMEQLQVDSDQGPNIDVQRKSRCIKVPDMGHETRWPAFIRAVEGLELRSSLSAPLEVEAPTRAVMSLYSTKTGAFDDDDVLILQQYAGVVAQALTSALRVAHHVDRAEDRRAAMQSRTAIDIATGIVMGQNRCSQTEAVSVLQNASNHRNIKMNVLAKELVVSVGGAEPKTPFVEP